MSTSPKPKSVTVGFILGLLLPGIGLAYAAPWVVAGIGAVVALVVYKLVGWIPLLGSAVMGVMALGSAVLGALYAKAYNEHGSRAPVKLADEPS